MDIRKIISEQVDLVINERKKSKKKMQYGNFENAPKPEGLRKKMKGVSLGKGKSGYCVYTHRARSKFYPQPEDIPDSAIKFIESTG